MITFRQNLYSKKKALKSVGKYVLDHPLIPVSTASLGVGIANYRVNTKRRNEGLEQHREQVKALKELNTNIVKNSEALGAVNKALEKHPVQRTEQYPTINKRPFTLFRKKFSIQDGGFKGRKVAPKKSKISTGAGIGAVIGTGVGLSTAYGNPAAKNTTVATIGAILGAGVGALVTWLNNIAADSIFNSGLATRANSYTLIKGLEDIYMPNEEEEIVNEEKVINRNGNVINTKVVKKTTLPKKTISPIGTLFTIDNDPKKHIVNILLRGNVLLALLNKPNKIELTKLNSIFDNYCENYKLADYTATKLDSNIYLVEVNVVESTIVSLVKTIIDSGLKVNILTTDRFGIKNK